MRTLHTRGTPSRLEWSEARLVRFAGETPTAPQEDIDTDALIAESKTLIDELARTGVTQEKLTNLKNVLDKLGPAPGLLGQMGFENAFQKDMVTLANQTLAGKVKFTLDRTNPGRVSFEILSNAPATNAEAAQRAAGLQERAGRNIEQSRNALFADLDAQEQRIQQQLDASPQQESFRLITRPGESIAQAGRIPNGPDMVREGGETGLAQDQQHKRELEKYATAQTTNADWGELPSYGKTDGKDVYMYRMVNGKLEAYTPRMGLQVLDAVSGRWAFVKGMNPDGSYKIGSRPGVQNLNDVYSQRMTAINQNPGARRQYDNNNTLEEGLLKPAMNGQNRMMHAQFLQQNPDIWTGPNGAVKNRFDLLNSLGGILSAGPGGRLNIPRFGPSQNPGEAALNNSQLVELIKQALALFAGLGGSPSSRERSRESEKEPEAPTMPGKFKTSIEAIKKNVADGMPKNDPDAFKTSIETFQDIFDNWGEGDIDDVFKDNAAIIKAKKETFDYVNKLFKKNISFTIENGDSADSTITFEILEPTEEEGEGEDEGDKEDDTAPAEDAEEKEALTPDQEAQALDALDAAQGINEDLKNEDLCSRLTYEFDGRKMTAVNKQGETVFTARFDEKGELKANSVDVKEDVVEAMDEDMQVTTEALRKLELQDVPRSLLDFEWNKERTKLTVQSIDGTALGVFEVEDGEIVNTEKKNRALKTFTESLEEKRDEDAQNKLALEAINDILDLKIDFTETDDMEANIAEVIDKLDETDREGVHLNDDGALVNDDGEVILGNFEGLLEDEGGAAYVLQELASLAAEGSTEKVAETSAERIVKLQIESIGKATDRWIPSAYVPFGEDGASYKVRDGSLYERTGDQGDYEYRKFSTKRDEWLKVKAVI